jgi:hypothetical protein
MSAFTPPPWELITAKEVSGRLPRIIKGKADIAFVRDGWGSGEPLFSEATIDANARLLVNAPKLYAAVKVMCELVAEDDQAPDLYAAAANARTLLEEIDGEENTEAKE